MDSDACTVFLFVCTEPESNSLGATRGKSVSLPEAGPHLWEDTDRVPRESVPSLCAVGITVSPLHWRPLKYVNPVTSWVVVAVMSLFCLDFR